MVQEVRKITLESGELWQALETYRSKNPIFIPQGAIVGLEAAENSTLIVKISTKDGIKESQIKFPDLLAPITAFCVAKCMPLPWKSQKNIEITGDVVTLTILVAHEEPEHPDQRALMLTTRSR